MAIGYVLVWRFQAPLSSHSSGVCRHSSL